MPVPRLCSRRDLLRATASAALALPALGAADARAASAPASPLGTIRNTDPWHGLSIGVASYTLRNLSLDTAIKDIQRVGLHYVSIKDAHLSLNSTPDERRAVVKQFKDAGITPLSCGNIGLKNDEANIRQAFEYARDAGLPTIVCSPDPASFPILDRMVKEFDIRIAIHNHGPGDRFPSPYDAWKAVQGHDPRLGLCIDVGHTARARVDPVRAILDCRERLYDCHFKDVNPRGGPIEVGRGILDIPGILKALLKIRYAHLASFEYEKDANDPLPGLAESVGYAKGVMTGIR